MAQISKFLLDCSKQPFSISWWIDPPNFSLQAWLSRPSRLAMIPLASFLHIMSLETCRYIWSITWQWLQAEQPKKKKKGLFSISTPNSINWGGKSRKPECSLYTSYWSTYGNSLVGGHFRILTPQYSPFFTSKNIPEFPPTFAWALEAPRKVDGAVMASCHSSNTVRQLTRLMSKQSRATLPWRAEQERTQAHALSYEAAPYWHTLVLTRDIRRFGPLLGLTTERYESLDAVFGLSPGSVKSTQFFKGYRQWQGSSWKGEVHFTGNVCFCFW